MMKKLTLIFTLILIFCVQRSYAQEQGNIAIGGMLGFSYNKQVIDGEKEANPVITLEFEPTLYFFPIKNLCIGAHVNFATQKQKNEDDVELRINTLMSGISIGYYIQLAERFYLTPEIGFAMIQGEYKETKEPYYINTEEFKGTAFQFMPLQFVFRPTKNFGLSAGIMNISVTKLKNNDLNTKTTNFSMGLNPTVGIFYYF